MQRIYANSGPQDSDYSYGTARKIATEFKYCTCVYDLEWVHTLAPSFSACRPRRALTSRTTTSLTASLEPLTPSTRRSLSNKPMNPFGKTSRLKSNEDCEASADDTAPSNLAGCAVERTIWMTSSELRTWRQNAVLTWAILKHGNQHSLGLGNFVGDMKTNGRMWVRNVRAKLVLLVEITLDSLRSLQVPQRTRSGQLKLTYELRCL